MSFPRYPRYKDSGVDWLGEVPDHWEVQRVRWLFKIKKEIAGELGHDVLSITQGGIVVKDTESNDGQLSMDYSKYQLVAPGDFAMNHMDLLTGYVDISQFHGVTSPDYRVFWLRDTSCCHPRYFLRLFQMGYHNKVFFAFGQGSSKLGRWRLPTDQFQDIRFPLPTFPEQSVISSFLDHETAKIDALIAEQQRLIDLLKEKRQAVISHAVTKGLNPNVRMKDSGIEWLGEVPEHWEVRKISHIFRAAKGKNGQMLTKEFCGANAGDYPVYSGQTEDDGVMGTWHQFEFDYGERGVLFSTTVGAKAMNLRQLYGRFSLSQNCMIIFPVSDRCLTRFFYYGFQPLFQFQRALIPEHMQASFRIEDLYGYKAVIPPVEEQSAIAVFLDSETSMFDNLTTEAQHAIDLLQERRTALISAAVTGLIDVRGHDPAFSA